LKVLIASGGSGGHIFPAIALSRELRREKKDVIFVASRRRLDRSILEREPYKKVFLSVNPMPHRFGISAIPFMARLVSDAAASFFILRREKPDVVAGFGGYTAGAMVLIASMMGIKTVIHEQNVVPGRTNKFLDRRASRVAVSFSGTERYFANDDVIVTGNPVREESLENTGELAFPKLGLEKGRFTILVMGGSQGARSLNRLACESLKMLSQEEKNALQVVHISGPKDEKPLAESYDKEGIKGRVFSFIRDINNAYSACDMAISRAGAAAIFELASFGKPMILVPYPDPANNQRFNARFFFEHDAAVYMEERDASAEKLRNAISGLMRDPSRRQAICLNAGKLVQAWGARRLKEAVLGACA